MGKSRKRNPEVSLGDLLLKIQGWYLYIRYNWRRVLLASLIGGLIGGGIAMLKKPVYVARTTFVLEDPEKNSLGQYANLAAIVGIDLTSSSAGGIFEGDNIFELYTSRTMIEGTLLTEVVGKEGKELLIDRYIDFNHLRNQWEKDPKLLNIQFKAVKINASEMVYSRAQDSILGSVYKDINENYLRVARKKNNPSIIEAEVKAKDEFFAKAFNEEIVKKVSDFYVQTKTLKSLANVKLLQRKTDSIRTVMNGGVYGIRGAGDGIDITPAKSSPFAIEANKAILSELVKNLEMSKINLQKEIPLIQIIDRPRYPLEKNSIKVWAGVLVGMFVFGFLAVLFLWIKKVFLELTGAERLAVQYHTAEDSATSQNLNRTNPL